MPSRFHLRITGLYSPLVLPVDPSFLFGSEVVLNTEDHLEFLRILTPISLWALELRDVAYIAPTQYTEV